MNNSIENITLPILIESLGYLYPNSESKTKRKFGLYKCMCGVEFKSQTRHIDSEATKSCGCYNKIKATKHGLNQHRLYGTWTGMINRCNNTKNSNFNRYGARGITVCERWMDVTNFIEDMYPTFEEGLSIDRINTHGNYEPSNCRWTTPIIQSRNTKKIRATNKSGYRGVHLHKATNKWRAKICVSLVSIHLGTFNTAIEASIAYDNYVIANNLEHTTNRKE